MSRYGWLVKSRGERDRREFVAYPGYIKNGLLSDFRSAQGSPRCREPLVLEQMALAFRNDVTRTT